jgi:hypothetical protein
MFYVSRKIHPKEIVARADRNHTIPTSMLELENRLARPLIIRCALPSRAQIEMRA